MQRPADNGFTLIEVLVALAVMGILLVGLLETLNYHLDVASQHEARTVTTQLASQKLTESREDHVPSDGDFEEPYQDYHYKVEVGDTKYPGVGYIAVTVTGHKERAVLKELFRIKQDSLTDEAEAETSTDTEAAVSNTPSGGSATSDDEDTK